MVDGKKVIKFLKDLKSIVTKLQPNTSIINIRHDGIYLIEEQFCTAFIKNKNIRSLFPYEVSININEFYDFVKDRKISDFESYDYSEKGAIIKFRGELTHIDGRYDYFIIHSYHQNGKYNFKKKSLIDSFISRENEFIHLEDKDPELKDMINNITIPYLYKGIILMKSVCPILTAKTELSIYDLRETTGLIGDDMVLLVFKVLSSDFHVYIFHAGLKKIPELKYFSKKR